MKQLDRYSLMIISQYLPSYSEFFNLLLTCKKCLPLIEMFHYNPFDLTTQQLSYFINLQTFHFYTLPQVSIELDPSITIVIDCEINYHTYQIFKKYFPNEIKCKRLCLEENERIQQNITQLNQIPPEVSILGISCFAMVELTSLDIPSTIHEIRENCFVYNHGIEHITKLIIPSTLTFIDYFACSLESIKHLHVHDGLLMEMSAFEGCCDIESVSIEKGNIFHGFVDINLKEMFEEQKIITPNLYLDQDTASIESIECLSEVPMKYKYISDYCFSNQFIESLCIPEGIISLGKGVFENCDSLVSITLPQSLTSIGEKCFKGCISLSSINIPSGITHIPRKCFSECSSLTTLELPSTIKSFGKDWKDNENSIPHSHQTSKKYFDSYCENHSQSYFQRCSKYDKNVLLKKYYSLHSYDE